MSKDEVPETVPQWAKEKACNWHNRHVTAHGTKWRPDDISCPPDYAIDSLALYIAAHEPAPVDPLREAVIAANADAMRKLHFTDTDAEPAWLDAFVEGLRARSVTAPAHDNEGE
jgi:hypothetical protein